MRLQALKEGRRMKLRGGKDAHDVTEDENLRLAISSYGNESATSLEGEARASSSIRNCRLDCRRHTAGAGCNKERALRSM